MILYLSGNNSFLPRQGEARHTCSFRVPTSCCIPGSHGEEGAGLRPVWQMSQCQELDPQEITCVASCLSGPVSGHRSLPFQHPVSLLSPFRVLFPPAGRESQLGHSVLRVPFIILWAGSASLGMGAKGQGRGLCSGDLFGALENIFIRNHVNVQI